MLEQGLHVFFGFGFVAAVGFEAVGVGREEVPTSAAAGFGVRRNNGDAVFSQVAPVLDAFWVALAHQKHDGRRVGGAGVG